MDSNINTILGNFENINNGDGKPCVCIHGGHGTGKTALLEQVKDSMLKKGDNVFFAIDKAGDGAIKELLRQLVRIYSDNYDPEFIDFITSYINSCLQATVNIEKDSLIKFIYNCIKSEPTVFIIDDLDMADDFTINLLSNLLIIDRGFSLVISLSDNVDSIILSDMLYRNANKIMYLKLSSQVAFISSAPISNEEDLVIDEVMLVLSKPGRESQLIKHYIKTAGESLQQLSYENAIQSLKAAFTVCQNTGDKDSELTVLCELGDARVKCKEFIDAADNYLQALQIATSSNLQDKRVLIFTKLTDCYNMMHKLDLSREYIMMAEAFFCIPTNRTEYYDIYSKHIINYLFILTELGEESIFSERLKQAYNICKPDDSNFAGALSCEEGYMYMHMGDFSKAHDKLNHARILAREQNNNKMWDEATNTLAICNEQLGKPEICLMLLNEIIEKSYDPVKVAGAMVNAAIISFESSGDSKRAIEDIVISIELCILVGENQIAFDIYDNLKNTPLASLAATHLSKYRLIKSR